jgi:tuftelin-interacting protein 11
VRFTGIWAEDSDEEDEAPARAGFGSKPSKNYSAPVGFVSGGIQQSGKKVEKPETDKNAR